MRTLFSILLASILFSANAQTVEQIITRFADASGGLANFNKVKTAKLTGTVSAQGNELPLTVTIINGRAAKTEVLIEQNNFSIVSSYKDGKGWKINPLVGSPDAVDVAGTELYELQALSKLSNTLMDYKARGHKVELLGQETVDSVKTFKISLTAKEDGRVVTYFITTADYVLLKTIQPREMNGQQYQVETYFSDVKTFKGLKFNMVRSQRIDGQEFQSLKFENIELDIPIDEKIFDKP